jgi:hypothetical protein
VTRPRSTQLGSEFWRLQSRRPHRVHRFRLGEASGTVGAEAEQSQTVNGKMTLCMIGEMT